MSFGNENDFIHACWKHVARRHEQDRRAFWEKLYWMALQYKKGYEASIQKSLPDATYFLKGNYKESIEIWILESPKHEPELCETITVDNSGDKEIFKAFYSNNAPCLESIQSKKDLV